MKRFIYALAFALALPSLWAAQHTNGNYVVTLVGNMSPDTVLRQHGLGAKMKWTHAIHGFAAPLTGNQADRLEQDTRVQFIEPDSTVHMHPYSYMEIGSPGMELASGYSARNAKYLDPSTGIVPVLLVTNYLYPSATFWISFVNYSAKTYSLAQVPVLGDPSYVQPGGGCCMMGTNVWLTMLENQFWDIKHFGTVGFPITNLVLIENIRYPVVTSSSTNSYCWYEQVHETLFPTAIGGILGGFRTPAPFSAGSPVYMNALYRDPLGLAWRTQIVGPWGAVEEIRTTYAQHPGDGAIWSFSVTPVGSACNITSTRGFERNNLYTNITFNKDFISFLYTTNVPWCAYGEIAPIGVITDTAHKKLVLTYPNSEYIPIVLPPPTQHPTIVVLDANGTWRPSRNTNSFLHFFDVGVLAMVDGDHYVVMYRPLAGPGSFEPGPLYTRTYTNLVGGDSGVGWGSETPLIPLADAFPSYIQNAPGLLLTSSTDLVTRMYYVNTTPAAGSVPTGVRRIGCLSNTVWKSGIVSADVAVLDTGIDLTHPDLNVYRNVSFVTGAVTGNDDNGHGTHVAGTIGAKGSIYGVAPGCRLWSVKVLDSGGNGPLSQVISGVDYVTQHASEIEVVNMSLGGQGSSDSLRLAIQNSIALGVVYVVSAGNSGFDVYGGDKILGTSDDFYPASYPEVLCVGAIGDSDGIEGGYGSASANAVDDSYASFSNYAQSVDSSKLVYSYGRAVDVCAPGVNIYSTYKGGTYSTMSGTSMSCPHAAGAVALYIAANGRATTAAGTVTIRQAIVDRAIDWNHWGQWAWSAYETAFSRGRPPLIDVADGAKPTNYPVVTMTSPFPGYVNTYQNNQSITCTATATDAIDGDITAKIVWRVCGAVWSPPLWSKSLGTGGSITATVTNMVYNNLSAAVTNSAGHSTEVSALLYIISPSGAVPPTVAISSPVDGSTVASSAVQTFTATATDPVDGNIASKLYWTSSLDGYLGQGASFTNFLSAGAQTITAAVTNVAGLSGSHSHNITVTGTPPPPPPTNYPPVVTIQQPANGQSYPAGTSITCVGTASDVEDGDLSANITWSDSIAGGLGRGATVTYTPVAGTHAITAQISDSSGALDTDTHAITITSVGTPLTVTVTANKAAYRNKEKALITTTVLQAGVAVSGATVTVQIRSSAGRAVASKTGTTTSAGTFAFYLPIQKAKYGTGTGPWTATVTANASKTGYVSGVGTTTYLVYP